MLGDMGKSERENGYHKPAESVTPPVSIVRVIADESKKNTDKYMISSTFITQVDQSDPSVMDNLELNYALGDQYHTCMHLLRGIHT